MRKMYRMILLLIMISISMSPVFAEDNQTMENHTTYRVLIDQNYGFFRAFEMYDKISGKEIDQKNRTLNISKGDTITFVSDTIPDRFLTIISEEKLWDNKNGTLKYSGKEFSYVFNKSGIYNMYIKERPHLKQKIIVGPIDANDINGTEANSTNRTNITNETKLNLTNGTENTNVTIIKQNTTTNKSSSVPISIRLSDGLFGKIRSKTDVSILTVALLVIYVLSGRIKENDK